MIQSCTHLHKAKWRHGITLSHLKSTDIFGQIFTLALRGQRILELKRPTKEGRRSNHLFKYLRDEMNDTYLQALENPDSERKRRRKTINIFTSSITEKNVRVSGSHREYHITAECHYSWTPTPAASSILLPSPQRYTYWQQEERERPVDRSLPLRCLLSAACMGMNNNIVAV